MNDQATLTGKDGGPVKTELTGKDGGPFQKQFIKAVENPRYGTVAISEPRSLGG